jgi:hypothetical protein
MTLFFAKNKLAMWVKSWSLIRILEITMNDELIRLISVTKKIVDKKNRVIRKKSAGF